MADNLPGIRPTPERYPALGAVARALQSVDKFGRAPFGYSNPPVEMLSDVLQVPQLARTLENVAYGSPLTRGAGQARQMTPDTVGALEALTNVAPGVAPAARLAVKSARASAPYAARHAVNLAEKYGVSPTIKIIPISKEEALTAIETSQKANLKHEPLLERLHLHYLNEDPKMAEVVEKTYDDLSRKVDLDAASKAYDQGFVLPGSRVSYSKHIGVRSPNAQYPGLHFASAGNEDQLKTLIEHYLGGFQEADKNLSPRIRPVLAQAKNYFRLSDEAFEYPDVLAKELGLSKQFQAEVDKFYSRPMNFQNIDPDAVKSAIISKMVADRGLDLGVYRNTVEGVLGPENTSYVSFGRNNIKGFAEGGSVEFDPARIDEIAQGLRNYEPEEGLAPHGLRHAGDSAKGKGYFGLIPGREGHMTEVSSEDDLGEFPLLVPGLTADEIRHLAEGNEPTEDIYRKAGAHADKRRAAGRSTFIGPDELHYPAPEKFAQGGVVEYNPAKIEMLAEKLREELHG